MTANGWFQILLVLGVIFVITKPLGMAHTNIRGSKHRKRYEDVLELLAEKIDVVSTLNIQHIESIAPVVRSITGITVRETVPDWPAHCHRNRNGGPHSGSLAKPHEAGRRL